MSERKKNLNGNLNLEFKKAKTFFQKNRAKLTETMIFPTTVLVSSCI